jgi:myo-inositol-hexaphosphate 3-phosphohydrolase
MPAKLKPIDLARATTRVSGHVELYKRDPDTNALRLISTSRPCEVCGQPLEGLVIPKSEARDERQDLVHASCRRKLTGGTVV